MEPELKRSHRILGSWLAVVLLAWSGPSSRAAADDVTRTIGTLPPGKSVTVSFRATIAANVGNPASVSNQGTISGTNFTDVLTDDPAVGGSADPTVTPVQLLTTTVVFSNINPSSFGQPVTFTATVSGAGPGFPSGTVQFMDGLSALGPAQPLLFIGAGQSQASVMTSSLTIGLHTITAVYAGDAAYDGSNGTLAGGQTVNLAATTTAVSSTPNPSNVGQAVDLTATVTGAGGTPTGTVQFKDNGSDIGSAQALSGGTATLSHTFTVAGTHPITAHYSGDSQYAVSMGTLPGGQVVHGTPATAGQLVISEFRLQGAMGAEDEFVEIANASGASHTVGTNDGSAGYALVASDGTARFVIPNGTVIPARGQYLIVNDTGGTGFSLGGYPAGAVSVGAGDGQYTLDIPAGGGIALFNSATTFDMATTRLDAAGFSGAGALYVEGGGLSPVGGIAVNGEYAFLRNRASGSPMDTNVNGSDFNFVSTNHGTYSSRVSSLGAPGPQSLASPLAKGASTEMSEFVIDPAMGPNQPPNRVRTPSAIGPNAPLGTLEFRRSYVNNTGQTVTRLRFRVVAVTTVNSPAMMSPPQAVLKLLTSVGTTVSTSLGPVFVNGLNIETPAAQADGAGEGSTVKVPVSMAPGSSIEVRYVLGVVANGSFKFFIVVETLP